MISDEYRRGIEDAIKIIERRGEEIRGAIQVDRTVKKIREELLK